MRINLRNENANLLAKVDSNVCNVSIANSRNNDDDLLARIEELNISLASLRIENEKLLAKAKDFDVCNATISDLRTKNDMLHAKVVELKSCKSSTSTTKHVTICTRCRGFARIKFNNLSTQYIIFISKIGNCNIANI